MTGTQVTYTIIFKRQVIEYMNEHFRTRNIELVVIPGGLTPYLHGEDI